MLIVSLVASLACALVFARGASFAMITSDRRQADNCEVAFICLWVFESRKMTSNSPYSTMFVGSTIVHAAYFFRRIEALTIGRERRRDERREEDFRADRRTRRPLK